MVQNNIFGERLRAKRTEKGISQNSLASKIGISRSLYNKYERAGTRPSHETLILMANELDTTVDYLVGKMDTGTFAVQKEEDSSNNIEKSEEYIELLTRAKELDADGLNVLIATARALNAQRDK